MRRSLLPIAFLLALVPGAVGQTLPELGDISAAAMPPHVERRIGETIARDIRLREPTYLDDPEVNEYLSALGDRLVAATPGVRQDFDFFALRDPSINAFALPGGFIGMHTGLVMQSDSESEIASVLAHEIAHVTQRHIARLMSQQQQINLPMMIALAAAIVIGSSRPDLAAGAAAAVQAGAVQTLISYTRDFEREADRVGFQMLAGAGFDVHAMATFFEKMQRITRVAETGTPGYLRTHPVTTERISDAQARAAGFPFRQVPDSVEYHLVRARLRAETGEPQDAVRQFTAALRDGRYVSEIGQRYGLVLAHLRARQPQAAAAELGRLRALQPVSPMIETLAARVQAAAGDATAGLETLRLAVARWPNSRPALYAYVAALQDAGRHAEALARVDERLLFGGRDERLWSAKSRAHAALGQRLLQHQSHAEVHALRGALPAAIEQLQLAQGAGDGDFFQLSIVEARLRELRERHTREVREARR